MKLHRLPVSKRLEYKMLIHCGVTKKALSDKSQQNTTWGAVSENNSTLPTTKAVTTVGYTQRFIVKA